MKRITGVMCAALIAASATAPTYALRRSTLRIGCGGFGTAVAVLTYGGLMNQRERERPTHAIAAVAGGILGVIAGGLPYLLLEIGTPDGQYDLAAGIVDQIWQTSPIVSQSFDGKHELLALLKGLYFGELWLIKARNDMQPLQERITSALSLIGMAKEGAYGDVDFINKCDELGKRARIALQNVSLALRAIEDAIANNSWETVR